MPRLIPAPTAACFHNLHIIWDQGSCNCRSVYLLSSGTSSKSCLIACNSPVNEIPACGTQPCPAVGWGVGWDEPSLPDLGWLPAPKPQDGSADVLFASQDRTANSGASGGRLWNWGPQLSPCCFVHTPRPEPRSVSQVRLRALAYQGATAGRQGTTPPPEELRHVLSWPRALEKDSQAGLLLTGCCASQSSCV